MPTSYQTIPLTYASLAENDARKIDQRKKEKPWPMAHLLVRTQPNVNPQIHPTGEKRMPSSSRRMPGGALVHSLMKQIDFRNSEEWPPEKLVTLSVKLISAGVRLNFSALRIGRPPVCTCFFAGRFKRVSLRSG